MRKIEVDHIARKVRAVVGYRPIPIAVRQRVHALDKFLILFTGRVDGE
jgi:hypothetical protein